VTSIAALGIGNWNTKNTKYSIIQNICFNTNTKSLDIGVLSIKELNKLKKCIQNISYSTDLLVVPNSRTKAPYVELLQPYLVGISLSKLSVTSLKELIGIVNKCLKENQ
jgi:hypothetical protein